MASIASTPVAANTTTTTIRDERIGRTDFGIESSKSAVSWGAILAGAFAAAAISLVILALGSALGFASVSPWSGHGVSATTFTVMTAIWFVVIQWLASAVGGYVTGRLRTKWVGAHTDEVFFRDTAHGFLSWAVATVLTIALLSSAVSTVVGGAATVAGDAAATVSAQTNVEGAGPTVNLYDVDTLFRTTSASPALTSQGTPTLADARAEAARILGQGLIVGDVPATDRDYLIGFVSSRTGVTTAEAQARVDNAIANVKAANVKARETADAARKAAAMFSMMTALSMLIGAFIACAAAALGGMQRDEN